MITEQHVFHAGPFHCHIGQIHGSNCWLLEKQGHFHFTELHDVIYHLKNHNAQSTHQLCL